MRTRPPTLAILLVTVLSALLSAQEESPRALRKRAQRLVTFMELPDKRRDASAGLLRLGESAVPALIRALGDPRPDVVCRCVQILTMLGPPTDAARARLGKLAQDKDPVLSHAGRWGLAGIRNLDITQVVDIKKDRVIELDDKGAVIREIKIGEQIYDADRLANGNYLVCLLHKGKVIEVDAEGKTIWKYEGCRNPLDADRLPNGNTLIAGGQSKRVLEVDPKGTVVWEWKGTNWPNDADRLPSGNTLIADSPAKRIYEVDPAGKIVWQLKVSPGVIDVQRLANGNTLYVASQRKGVVEADPTGKVVRRYDGKNLRAAYQGRDGRTVVGGNDGVVLLDAAWKVIWRTKGLGQVNAVHRY